MRVFTLDKAAHLFAHLAVSFAILAATARHFFRSTLFRVTAFIVLASSFSLTEMAIAAPVLLALFQSVIAKRPSERWLAFVLPLVRIDLACVPLVVAAGLFPKERRRAMTLALLALSGAGLQLVTMKLLFGEWLGVAAWLKATGSTAHVVGHLRFNLVQSSFQAGLLGAHVAFAVLALRMRRERLTWVLVASALSFLVMHLALSLVRGWYLVPSTIALLFVLEHAMQDDAKPAAPTKLARASVALVALVFVVHGVRAQVVYAGDQRVASTFMSELRARVPAGAPIYTWDNPGFIGFFSGFPVVDGDGLVNDHAYARRLRERRLAGYLDEERICHLVIAEADDDPVLDVAGLVVRRSEAELLYVIRRKEASQADFALYRVASERCSGR